MQPTGAGDEWGSRTKEVNLHGAGGQHDHHDNLDHPCHHYQLSPWSSAWFMTIIHILLTWSLLIMSTIISDQIHILYFMIIDQFSLCHLWSDQIHIFLLWLIITIIIVGMIRSNQRGTRRPLKPRLGGSQRTWTGTAVRNYHDYQDLHDYHYNIKMVVVIMVSDLMIWLPMQNWLM